jgi:hypothetical protein
MALREYHILFEVIRVQLHLNGLPAAHSLPINR